MKKYYYLVSSLPSLKFGDEPPVTREEFIAECEKWLSPADMKTLLSADLRSHEIKSGDTDALREWKSFDSGLRQELAKVRTARKTSESYRVPERLKEIMEQETPLLMEGKLERMRWDFIEDRSSGRYFDINWLVLYFLKLQILERLAGFDKDTGEKTFYDLCEVKYEQAVGQNNSD